MMPYIIKETISAQSIRQVLQTTVTINHENPVIEIPAGTYVLSVVVTANQDEVLQVSDVAMGDTDIEADFPAFAGQPATITINKLYPNGGTIYFDGYNDTLQATLMML